MLETGIHVILTNCLIFLSGASLLRKLFPVPHSIDESFHGSVMGLQAVSQRHDFWIVLLVELVYSDVLARRARISKKE